MTKQTPATIEHLDCRRMALALEGVAGTVQSGLHVDARDLQSAAQVAQWVWDAGPDPEPRRALEFDSARAGFLEASSGCANGFAREGSIVEREARRMARELRYAAAATRQAPVRKELPTAVDGAIRQLLAKYARNAAYAAA